MSARASGLGPREKNPKSLEHGQKHSPDTFRRVSGDFPDCPRDFWRLFQGPRSEAQGDILETFSAFRARRARESPVTVRGGLVPNCRGVTKKCGNTNVINERPLAHPIGTHPKSMPNMTGRPGCRTSYFVLNRLSWAKSRDSYHSIDSESYRRDSNQ